MGDGDDMIVGNVGFVVEDDVSSIGACRPRIFFINGFLCFLEDECQWNGE